MTRNRGHGKADVTVDAMNERALTALLVLQSLALFIAAPLAGMGFHGPLVGGSALAVLMMVVIVIASPGLDAKVLAVLAAMIGLSGMAFRIEHPSPTAFWMGHIAAIVAIFAISLAIGRAVFAPGPVTHHRIQGAIVLYLNIAVAFTSAYRLIAELSPGAFVNLPAVEPEAAIATALLYFSFTTLTSTGFGEILPVHPFARSLANLEAVMGQLYLTIMLARLVSMHLETRRAGRH